RTGGLGFGHPSASADEVPGRMPAGRFRPTVRTSILPRRICPPFAGDEMSSKTSLIFIEHHRTANASYFGNQPTRAQTSQRLLMCASVAKAPAHAMSQWLAGFTVLRASVNKQRVPW